MILIKKTQLNGTNSKKRQRKYDSIILSRDANEEDFNIASEKAKQEAIENKACIVLDLVLDHYNKKGTIHQYLHQRYSIKHAKYNFKN